MSTVDIVGLLVPVTYFVFLLTERLWPARDFPPRRAWHWIGLGIIALGRLRVASLGAHLRIAVARLSSDAPQPQRVDIFGSLVFHPTEIGFMTGGARRLGPPVSPPCAGP
jgi:hypothetical protein